MTTLSQHITEGLAATDDAKHEIEIGTNVAQQEEVDESVNEGLTEWLGSLSADETNFLIGAAGALGMTLTAAAYSKFVDYAKKKGGPVAKKIIDKLEELGSNAGKTAQQK